MESTVEWLITLEDGWNVAGPLDASGTREELFHQVFLRAQLNLNVTVTDSWLAAVHDTLLEVVDSGRGLGVTGKLDKAVHGLASRTLHDDVDGVVGSTGGLVDEASIATDCSDNLVLGCTIGYLGVCQPFVSHSLFVENRILTLRILTTPKLRCWMFLYCSVKGMNSRASGYVGR